MPDTIKYWGHRSFQKCDELINLNIPDSLEEICIESSIMDSPWFSNYVQNENNFDNGILYIGNVAYTTEYNAISYTRKIFDDSLLVQGEIRFKEGTIGISPDLGLPHQLITNIIIPNSIKFIGEDAFGNISDETLLFPNLTGITILATTPPRVKEEWEGGMFGKHETYPIYVPAESLDTYKTADIWSNYASRIFAIQS